MMFNAINYPAHYYNSCSHPFLDKLDSLLTLTYLGQNCFASFFRRYQECFSRASRVLTRPALAPTNAVPCNVHQGETECVKVNDRALITHFPL